MTLTELVEQIKAKQSFLCVGLDSDLQKIPAHLHREKEPLFAFNKAIIDATADCAVAYKPNTAFYEAAGEAGWMQLRKTAEYIRTRYPHMFLIADAKRGDIGNTSNGYAKAFFSVMDMDAVTLSPYMGRDTVQPFLEYDGKWVVLLALTSNTSAADFELMEEAGTGKKLYEKVIETSKAWGSEANMMYVAGATKAGMLQGIRKIIPHHFLLVPGIGAQGGSLSDVMQHGMNKNGGLLVNASRAIIYASSGKDFAAAAEKEAKKIQREMESGLSEHGH
ncbi:MAG: orotidine-5'-phosphate decarboxylase [Prevotellaceae bacterium]|jgi:orotidine-5'-phosphate decarboxylase|nr:orotidine-5'-phosphate decarboxylase [Prevotellaceae bacterium]